jgi:uncharacterized protein (DUF1800 family)
MPVNEVTTPVSFSMNPYTGPWTKEEAAHLLRRTMFGPTNQQILDAVTNGMATTVTNLLQIPAISDPLAFDANETIVPFGTTWVNSVYPSDVAQAQLVETARLMSLGSWVIERINTEQVSIAEKMCLFWQNHFAATAGSDARATYDYHMLIRQHALGNFKQFVKDMTINPNMLLFLNGATNNVFFPNENFARELLELFTIGKGPQIGPGDYSNYTEDDIFEAAKVLTGYYVDGLRSDTVTDVTAIYNGILHDTSTKTLSYHFGNATITDNGANEYGDLIDIIFQQNECANFICRKLYRYFVNYDLTTDVETNVIPDMASTLITNNYDILPVLSQLFQSEHFYDIAIRGAIIRGPLDMVFSMFNATGTMPGFDLDTDSQMRLLLYGFCEQQGQSYAAPPSVAGWPAYYQTPAFSQLWINATTLKSRFEAATGLTLLTGIPINGENLRLDALNFLDNLSDPTQPSAIIADVADVFAPKGLSVAQTLILQNLLLQGLSVSDWQMEYGLYLSDPTNPTYADPIRARMSAVLHYMFRMPEFHVM